MNRSHRIAVVAALAVTIIVVGASAAGAHHPAATDFASGPDHEFGEMVDYPLVFPVDGPHTFSDWFWAPRGGGSIHHGQDIMAAKMTPVLAAAAGEVLSVNWSSNPDNLNPDRCCTIVIRHDDGWRSWYLHLNDDSSPSACDGEGWGIVDGIVPGAKVTAGQHIGWVGNSGNASCDWPHLHFELHDAHGVIVNPYESLRNPVSPSYCTGPEVGCTRIAGPTRYDTAIAVSNAHHHEPETIDLVYVTSGANFPDALAGAAMAARSGHPMLLVQPDAIPQTVADEIARIGPASVIILGGPASVSTRVQDQLEGAAFGSPVVTRLAGANRYETAVAISRRVFGDGEPDFVVMASGESFPDALPAGTLAARLGAPVLLTPGATLPSQVRDEIARLAPSTIYVLGGPASVSDAVIDELGTLAATVRVAGPDRYATAVEASKRAFPTSPAHRVYVTVGTNYPDGLTGGAAAGFVGAPLLLVPPDTLPAVVRDEILRLGPTEIMIIGGAASIGPGVEAALKSLVVAP